MNWKSSGFRGRNVILVAAIILLAFSSSHQRRDSLRKSLLPTISQKNETHTSIHTSINTAPPDGTLEVAWLMSFPNSGTTYTNHLIQEYTKTTTATNYGKEQSEKAASIPVLPGLDLEGPYFRYPTWEKPPTYILTKTHCASSTNDMPLHVIDSVEAFEITCSSGSRLEVYNGTTAKIPATYSPSLVKRAVHLIRNPFDNVVARFHMKINNWKAKNYHNDSISSNIYNSTSEGFKAYCQFRDKPFSKLKWNSTRIFGPNIVRQYELAKLLKDLPCYEQFVYYIRWHNFAMEMLQRKGIPVLTLFYEDYSLRFEDTVKGLLNFLSLTPAKDTSPPEFFPGKQYLDFYEPSEREAAKRLMLGLANKELNLLLQRYLVA